MSPLDVPFRLVDVFGTGPFTGNQLCVVPEPVGLDDGTMLTIAREIAFSETTFVTEASGDRYAMRIFTPAGELPFAGHPSLGTAFVLVREGRVRSPATQVLAAGRFRVEVDLDASLSRLHTKPETGPEVDRARAAAAAGLDAGDLDPDLAPGVASGGLPFVVVPARDGAAVARARQGTLELGPLLEEAHADGLYLVALGDEGEVKARMFDATLGIGEDAATGAAAAALGAYLVARGSPGRYRIRQGEEIGRPSLLGVETVRDGGGWRIVVSGQVHAVGEGRFEVP